MEHVALDVPWIAAQAQRIDQLLEDAHPTEEGTATKAEEGAATKTEEGTATKTPKDTESRRRAVRFLTERAFKGAPEAPPHMPAGAAASPWTPTSPTWAATRPS